MAKQLTARQRQVLDAIRDYIVDKGYCPSIRELGPMLGISSLRGVTIHLEALERKGWITRENKSRSIRMLGPTPDPGRSVPLLGTISAGIPLLAVENVESHVIDPVQMAFESDEVFALKVRGDRYDRRSHSRWRCDRGAEAGIGGTRPNNRGADR